MYLIEVSFSCANLFVRSLLQEIDHLVRDESVVVSEPIVWNAEDTSFTDFKVRYSCDADFLCILL